MEPMPTDSAVRSILVASALVDRLAELMRPRHTDGVLAALAGSKSAIATLAGSDAAEDALALRIGEAQQISPEVWRHLDDARAELVRRGVEVAGYDELRSLQTAALLATSNIDVQRKLDYYGLAFGQFRTIQAKSVTWDTGNLTSAIAACELLKRALPDVDWAEIERAQAAQIASAGSLRTRRVRSLLVGVAVVVAVLAVGVGIHTWLGGRHDDAAQIDAAAAAQADAARKEAARKDAAAKAAALAPAYAATPCDKELMRKYTAYLYAAGDAQKSDALVDKFAADCAR
jgi:hypothetical protein